MIGIKLAGVIGLVAGVMMWMVMTVGPVTDAAEGNGGPGFALVELFTSEGCSSCPPADALLARIAADARHAGRSVYCIAMHVDYWDRLGWRDPYSDHDYTQRQQEYARHFHSTQIYTPQMIVNGADGFVGSDRDHAQRAIDAALAKKPTTTLKLHAAADGHTVTVQYDIADAPADCMLAVAWVQDYASSKPTRGENGGRQLEHVNVARDLHMIKLDAAAAKGELTLKRPNDEAGHVIAFVQQNPVGRVSVATSAQAAAK